MMYLLERGGGSPNGPGERFGVGGDMCQGSIMEDLSVLEERVITYLTWK